MITQFHIAGLIRFSFVLYLTLGAFYDPFSDFYESCFVEAASVSKCPVCAQDHERIFHHPRSPCGGFLFKEQVR